MGCRPINEYHRDVIGDVVPLSMIAKPELLLSFVSLTKAQYEQNGMDIARGLVPTFC